MTDFYSGGDLSLHLSHSPLSEPYVAFYTAELVVALDCLHSQHMVYRDLKPENIILDEEGHIHLVDFGLCKKITANRKWSTGGTPEYMPPEVLDGKVFTDVVDWWQLGILVWQLLTQTLPFEAPTIKELYNSIKLQQLQKPDFMSITISLLIRVCSLISSIQLLFPITRSESTETTGS